MTEDLVFTSPPARIMVAGDWHANLGWARYMVKVAAVAGCTHIVQLGDFGYTFDPSFVSHLTDSLVYWDVVLGFVDGNHDDHQLLGTYPAAQDGSRQLSEGIWYLPRGMRWSWEGYSVVAAGGAHSVDRQWRVPGLEWWAGETISHDQAELIKAGGRADVMLCHDAPAGVPLHGLAPPGTFPVSESALADEHRAKLRDIVDVVQPRMLWHGHYHASSTEMLHGHGYTTTVRALNKDGASDNYVIVDNLLGGGETR